MCGSEKCAICRTDQADWLDNACVRITVRGYDQISVCQRCRLKHFQQIKEVIPRGTVIIRTKDYVFDDVYEFEAYCKSDERKRKRKEKEYFTPSPTYGNGAESPQYTPTSPTYGGYHSPTLLTPNEKIEKFVEFFKPVSFYILVGDDRDNGKDVPFKDCLHITRRGYKDQFTVEKFYNVMGYPLAEFLPITDWGQRELEKTVQKIDELTVKRRKLENFIKD